MGTRYRLKEQHPTLKKLTCLSDLADELGIRISFVSGGICVVTDKDQSGQEFRMEDIEPDWPITEFPPVTEYKLVIEKS